MANLEFQAPLVYQESPVHRERQVKKEPLVHQDLAESLDHKVAAGYQVFLENEEILDCQ